MADDVVTSKPVPGSPEDMHRDSGYASRKLWLSMFAMCLIFVGGVLAGTRLGAGLGANLPTVVGGIVGCLGIFAGANVAIKAQAAKAEAAKTATPAVKGKK